MDNIISSPQSQWRYQLQQYGMALLITGVGFAVALAYMFWQRGAYDLYMFNKAVGDAATMVLGIVLLLGPLSRWFAFPDRYLQYRKELGIMVFGSALLHGLVSLFFLQARFPLSSYFGRVNWPFIYGLIALLLLIGLWVISYHRLVTALGKRWWRLQYWGVRLVFVLVILHVYVMKWDRWIAWYRTGGRASYAHPEFPDAGLLLGWFMAFVFLVRVADFVNPKLGRAVWYASLVLLPVAFIATFWWGRQFAA